MASKLLGKIDLRFVYRPTWPATPSVHVVKVLVGEKCLYYRDQVADLMLGADLPRLPNQEPLEVLHIGFVDALYHKQLHDQMIQAIQQKFGPEKVVCVFAKGGVHLKMPEGLCTTKLVLS